MPVVALDRPRVPALARTASDDAIARGRSPRRARLVDATAIALAAVLGALLLADRVGGAADGGALLPTTGDLLLGLVASLALAWRRSRPVAVAVAVGIVAAVVTSAGVAAAIALFTVAVHRPVEVVAPIAGLHLVTIAPYVVLNADPTVPMGVEVLLGVVITATVVAWGMVVRARRLLVLSLSERAERAEAEQGLRVEQARDHERARIAREMHDVLAHRLSLVSLHAGALEFRARGTGAAPDEVAQAAAVVRAGAHEALEDLRTVIGVLRDEDAAPSGRPQPTLADLPALVAESRAAGVRVDAAIDVDDLAAVPAATGRAAYRIVQEGLTNARKHAPACGVRVRVAGRAGAELTVAVHTPRAVGAPRDDGAAIPGTGAGLVGLAERAALAGGALRHGPTPDGGFALEARLPWPA